MQTILVASQNPVKLRAALHAFRRMFPADHFHARGLAVPSGVSRQPFGSEETRAGALNRAREAARLFPNADYWVGIEGGVEAEGEHLAAFAWVIVLSPTLTGQSRTGTFFLPRAVAELVRAGKELGEADDIVFQRTNSKQEEGAIGLLTGSVIDRAALYEHAVILALVPFRNPQHYPPGG